MTLRLAMVALCAATSLGVIAVDSLFDDTSDVRSSWACAMMVVTVTVNELRLCNSHPLATFLSVSLSLLAAVSLLLEQGWASPRWSLCFVAAATTLVHARTARRNHR